MTAQPDASLPGHARDPTGRFADRAADYALARPTYPAPIIDALFAAPASGQFATVADVGAGTGISARLLAERAALVLAVEPNAAMRAAATPHPRIRWLDATGEHTDLGDASVDLVCCFQAFHWMRPAETRAEFARILRSGGRVALVWNDRDEADPFTHGYGRALSAASRGLCDRLHERVPPDLADSGLFAAERTVHAAHGQPLSAAGLLARAMSASYAPKAGPDADRLTADLAGLHARFADAAGLVHLRYTTRAHLAERV